MNEDSQLFITPSEPIDAPIPFFFWDPLEAILAVIFIGAGMFLQAMGVGLFLAVITLWGAKHLRRGRKRGQSQQALWAAGLELDESLRQALPGPYDVEFIE